jgi:hypothetical protein
MTFEQLPEPLMELAPVPCGDHPIVTDHLARTALQLVSEALTDMRDMLSVHSDMAPASAAHMAGLIGVLSGATLDWLERWPQ